MHPSGKAVKTALSLVVPSALLLVISAAGQAAPSAIPLGSFRSVTLQNGGEVTVRHSSTQRVILLEGDLDHSSVTIVDGDRLVIDRCPDRCPRGYELAIEILTPNIDDVLVRDGGAIEILGAFPRKPELHAMVEDGGIVDLRAMTIDRVVAAVRQGGRILAKPRETLLAEIAGGGVVTYWGNPEVISSIEDGGAVSRGSAADATRPLHELGPRVPAVPPVLPVPPLPPAPPAPPAPPNRTETS